MKPMPLTTFNDSSPDSFNPAACKRNRVPMTDYSYQAVALGGSSGRYTRYPSRSFWKIADGYLKDEARRDFQSEGMLFVVIAITAALPLINNVHALIEFVRAITSN
jgi:hypothetical protein